jgi:hypothetical protein
MRAAQPARHDVQPLTWELPAAGAAAWLAGAALLLPAGQGMAGVVFGRGWAWPRGGRAVLASIGGLASGHPGRGMTALEANRIPAAGSVYLLIVVAELLLAAGAVYAVVLWWRHLGPGVHLGMADRAEAEDVLGLTRLRQACTIIRPDLYGQRRPGLSR